MLVTSVNRRDV